MTFLDLQQRVHGDSSNNIFEHDIVLWAGDFNSRMWEDARMQSLTSHAFMFDELQVGKHERLLKEHDELNLQRAEGGPFALFKEAAITFSPTYKLDDGRKGVIFEGETFSASRVPAWTDRVLWRVQSHCHLQPCSYDRISTVVVSDHRPVRLVLETAANKIEWSKLTELCSAMSECESARGSESGRRRRWTMWDIKRRHSDDSDDELAAAGTCASGCQIQ